jgi:tetratricopeptide (TPR) repeat protein
MRRVAFDCRLLLAALLLALPAALLCAQATAPARPQSTTPTAAPGATAPTAQPAAPKADSAPDAKLPRTADRRRAAKLFLDGGKLFLAKQYEDAMRLYEQAANLDPTNKDYPLAVGVARSHAVTALVQSAAKARLLSDAAGARAALERALKLEPNNPLVTQHLYELGDDALLGQPAPLQPLPSQPGPADAAAPKAERQSFHLNADTRQVMQQVFRAYGLEATLDDSVRYDRIRFEIDDASFEQATSTLALVTKTFYVPLDAHHVLVARDTRELRQQYTRLEMETLHLAGLSANELTEMANLAKNVFDIQTATTDATAGTITVRAAPQSLDAFNRTLRPLLDGHSQVVLDVRLIQVAHASQRVTGVQAPQSMSAFNVYAEEQSILSSNATEVAEIISSGLASANDPLAILGILIAAGDVSSSLFSSGLATFGGGITESALSPGSATFNFNLNSSDSRQLDRVALRLGDGEAGTLRLGSRYPIQTSSYSSMASSSSISGVTTSGTSSALTSLLSSLESSLGSTVPMIEYQDLGFTLKATPDVMRNGRISLSLEMKIDALSGATMNGNPVLNSRSYSGVVQVNEGDAVVVASELDRSESRAVSGTPGIDDIPGFSSTDSRDTQKNYATLLVVVTPHIVRGAQSAGHSPQMRIERGTQTN